MFDHVGLQVRDIETSRRFYRAALAAFLIDPDGNNVEAVCLSEG